MLFFGNTPVPYTVLWSAEAMMYLAPCRFADGLTSVCNDVAPGKGKPIFGKPHMQRHRQAIVEGLCDLCGRRLANRTKVSLSHAQARYGGEGWCVMQVEPLLHKACAARCVDHCPSLKRDVRNGSLHIRQVTRHRVQMSMLTADAAEEFTGVRRSHAIGHAKVELVAWKDRPVDWLSG